MTDRVAFVQVTAGVDGKKFPKIECFKCKEMGHFADKCPSRESTEGVNAFQHGSLTTWNACECAFNVAIEIEHVNAKVCVGENLSQVHS